MVNERVFQWGKKKPRHDALPTAMKAFRLFSRKAPHDDLRAAPVFIFAACWRSGSTLLQRVVNASGEVFIWGEPRFLPQVRHMHDRIMNVQKRSPHFNVTPWLSRRSAWIPTAFPPEDYVRAAFHGFFTHLYSEPARKMGYARWGFKEVRPRAVEAAEFLSMLFPEAKFLFLVRDPIDTYTSLKNKAFFSEFSDSMAPMDCWRENVAAFLDVTDSGRLPALLIRLEDLAQQKEAARSTLDKLCDHIGIRFKEAMLRQLSIKVGDSQYQGSLTPAERNDILVRTGDSAARLGYAGEHHG